MSERENMEGVQVMWTQNAYMCRFANKLHIDTFAQMFTLLFYSPIFPFPCLLRMEYGKHVQSLIHETDKRWNMILNSDSSIKNSL